MKNKITTTELTIKERSRFSDLKEKIKDGLDTAFSIGFALSEIRDSKLYRQDFDTFEEFCQSEYKIERRRAYKLMDAAAVKESVKMCPMGHKLENERQALSLAEVPEDQREEVLDAAVTAGPLTAAGIAKAAEAKKQKDIELDKTGCAIPESILSDWKRAEHVSRELLSKMSDVRCAVKAAIDEHDLVFAELSNGDIADFNNAYTHLKCVVPYAVCPTCQGHQRKKCSLCVGRGFLSEFRWKQCVPSEIKMIREKVRRK